MESLTIDVLNEEAVEVINGLEQRGLIKVWPNANTVKLEGKRRLMDYWGAMSKEDRSKLDQQLDELRNAW